MITQIIWDFHTGRLTAASMEGLFSSVLASPLGQPLMFFSTLVDLLNGDSVAASYLGDPAEWRDVLLQVPVPPLVWEAWWCTIALVGALVQDDEMCRRALQGLEDQVDQHATVAYLVLVGPIGWFVAKAHLTLGDVAAAQQANARAETVSRRLGATVWVVQCLVQRAELLVLTDPRAARAPAQEALNLAAGLTVPALVERAEELLARIESSDDVSSVRGGRQEEILELAAQGLTNEQIARRLFVAVSTVERHFTVIYRRLRVRNRAEAIALWATARQATDR